MRILIFTFDFGAKPNGFNVLNYPDSAYVSAEQFWLDYNKPFLEQAIQRGNEIIMATIPNGTALKNNDGTLTGFGREYDLLTTQGYNFDSVQNKMIKN